MVFASEGWLSMMLSGLATLPWLTEIVKPGSDQWLDRLTVVMAIEKDGARCAGRGQRAIHERIARGVEQFRRETVGDEKRSQVVCVPPDVRPIGRHVRDGQEIQQLADDLFLMGLDPG